MLGITCIECGSTHIIKDYQRGETVCCECGLVQEDFIISQVEITIFNEEGNGYGEPMNYTLIDKGLSTEISWNNRDYYGNRLGNTSELYRLRKLHKKVMVSENFLRNLTYSLKELNRMTTNFPSNVRETSAFVYRKAVKKRLIVGRNAKDFMIASIYFACRICNLPRTIDEILENVNIEKNLNTKKKIIKSYKLLKKELGLKIPPLTPEHYIPRFCSKLKLHHKTERRAEEIIKLAEEKGITGGANSIAAAAIYLASKVCNEKRTQRDIANKTGVTDATIRSRAKELSEKLGLGK